jgi:transketolase
MEIKRTISSPRKAYGEILVELGARFADVTVLDADLSSSTQTRIFASKYPERFFNMGISEQDMIGTAVGLALSERVVFVSSFAIFASGRAWEQVRNTLCYTGANVKIVATHGGITVGEDGSSHQALEDIALMRVIPNMQVVVPCDASEVRKVVEFAYHKKGPFFIRLPRTDMFDIAENAGDFQPGKAKLLREGSDVTIIACGTMVARALDAASDLALSGIYARVINMASIKPIDEEAIIKAARETRGIVTVEEHTVYGGLGSAVAEVICQAHPAHMEFVGIRGKFGESGSPEELLTVYGLTSEEIIKHSLKILEKTGARKK